MTSRVHTVLVSRGSTTGLVVVASAHPDLPEVSFSSSSPSPVPSDVEVVRLLKQRAQLHFSNDGKFEMDRLVLHYKVLSAAPCTLVYACVAEPSLSAAEAQAFLASIHGELVGDARTLQLLPHSTDYSLQDSVGPLLEAITMAENGRSAGSQKMSDLQRQVQEVKAVMSHNVEQIIERGERLDRMEERTDALAQSSESFKTSARRVQRKFCQQNAKWTIISIVGGLAVLTVVILIILAAAGVFKN